ncbi:hypothetical protein PIB30_106596 [Stylosanthes scabra]|uniref:Uncharacterized protein n=1 Tax=Stylosanthes scabra TaxID=79078 RepID=A0ABU6QZ12_9FABA|nr:hypothetical protein [Stylosanthes scabra]
MACGICGGPHENHNCMSIQDDQFSTAQVNFVNNQPRPPYNDPHSNTYNPSWRNHPNFSWGNQGQQKQFNSQAPQNSQRQTSFPPAQPLQKQPNFLEDALTKNSELVARAAAGRSSNGAVAGELKTCAPAHGCLLICS